MSYRTPDMTSPKPLSPLRATAGLLLSLSLIVTAAGPAAAKRRPRDEGVELNAALGRCLRATPSRPLRVSGRPATSPGIVGDGIRAWRVAAANGPAIVYEGNDPKVVRCGIALYGPVTNDSIQRLLGLIARVPRLQRQSPDVLPSIDNPGWASSDRLYWGDPLGPALRGVVMAIRKPSPGLPTLAIEAHTRVAW
jgi:hypothetical protein